MGRVDTFLGQIRRIVKPTKTFYLLLRLSSVDTRIHLVHIHNEVLS